MSGPKAWAQVTAGELASIRGVCLDIDDTLSTNGKLTAEAYASLWALRAAGFAVVPITGRPAGWCDHIARFWPVNAVVGENGAFTMYMKDGVLKRSDTPGAPKDHRARLDAFSKALQVEFPEARWASDQSYREFDLAIDICEDVPAWPKEEIERLLEFSAKAGAHAKLSSIHVNAWFGDYDKKAGFMHFAKHCAPELGLAELAAKTAWIFIGDSPNDEPLFEFFPAAVGVANLTRYLARLQHPPRWMTAGESGTGFAEMARRLTN